MTRTLSFTFLLILLQIAASGQTIRVNPTGVNVNSQNATTVFLTFGQIPPGYVPAEAIWCGELVPATAPAQGLQCRPDTIYGALPSRYNLATASGSGGLTDIMAIPPSVVRRAYQDALRGESAGFFYVRRFVSNTGQPDQFVNVTCRMSSGGTRVPFALTNVELKTPSGEPVLFIKSGEKFPAIVAEIQYNGTGRLKGRWEIVQPGEDAPDDSDLLTEATLPVERRGGQRRYTQIARFNHFLQPTGKFNLPLEMSDRAPTLAAGQYILLLRIEATDDKESDSDLAAVGVGSGIVHSGAVASFPMPTLKFFVSGIDIKNKWSQTSLVSPQKDTTINVDQPPVFSWRAYPDAAAYRLEIVTDDDRTLLSAITLSPITSYRSPSWFWSRIGAKKLGWRVVVLDANGEVITGSSVQRFYGRE